MVKLLYAERSLAIEHNCDIIIVDKTWPKPRTLNEQIDIKGYYLLRNERKLCMGGCVVCYINKPFRETVLSISTNDSVNEPEFIIAKIIFPSNENILLATV